MIEPKRKRITEKTSCCRNTPYTDHVTNEGRRYIIKSNSGQRENVDNTEITAGQRGPFKQGYHLVSFIFVHSILRSYDYNMLTEGLLHAICALLLY